jgi:hypothetical protein
LIPTVRSSTTAALRQTARLAPTFTVAQQQQQRRMASSSVPVPTDFNKYLYTTLAEADPEVAKIVEDETWRQFSGLELIASEVSSRRSVRKRPRTTSG